MDAAFEPLAHHPADGPRAVPSVQTLAATAIYHLSETGRKASLLAGGNGKGVQRQAVQVPVTRLHLVSVGVSGHAKLKLQPRFERVDGRVVRHDTPPSYDALPTLEELLREAAKNYELSQEYRSGRAEARDAYLERRSQVAVAFLQDASQRAMMFPPPNPARCFLNKHLLERKQLHKYLEPHSWIFGPHFHLATSDKGFRTVMERQRQEAKLDALDEAALDSVDGIDKIPDLYLAAKRDHHLSDGHRHDHLIVEIKRPTQKVDASVVAQGERYAAILNGCAEFDSTRCQWDLFLVSSEIDDHVVNLRRRKQDRTFGLLDPMGCVRLWAFTWGEIISSARDEMKLVHERLETKSLELSASEYLQKRHPAVLPVRVKK